jgi:glyoxylase-like metal-dependent hydrolase (beta-lactamase superfamily II)
MVAPSPKLVFDTSFSPQTGAAVRVADGLVRVTAPNAGPYTFTGTNSFILGNRSVVVVDPGPDDASHLEALRTAIAGRKVEAILLTHTHTDHSALAPRLKAATGAPIWFGGKHRLSRPARSFEINGVAGSSDWRLEPDRVLQGGDRLALAGFDIEVVATPGHCANHLAFGLGGTDILLSGDHVMGWNSTMVSVPDGSMADYLASLNQVIALPYARYLPAHGGPIAEGPTYAAALLAHREERNRQVVAAVTRGARRIGDLLRAIYPGLPLNVVPAARMTLKAHVEYLEERRAIVVRRGLLGTTLSLP